GKEVSGRGDDGGDAGIQPLGLAGDMPHSHARHIAECIQGAGRQNARHQSEFPDLRHVTSPDAPVSGFIASAPRYGYGALRGWRYVIPAPASLTRICRAWRTAARPANAENHSHGS